MATQTPQPVTHVYKAINEGKYKSVKHYELLESNKTPLLSTLINISINQNCAKSMPDYWLRIREGNKWTDYITGLFKTSTKAIYKGDTHKKRNLLIFKFLDNGSMLTIDYYENFYTRDLTTLLK
jgi:hypothetical protein